MDVTFVTSNPNKLAELRSIFRPYGITVRWSRRELPEPQAVTLDAVVRSKLAAVDLARPGPILVEDSGIFLNALGGFPGVYSKYVYETIGLEGILCLLKGKRRTARFCTVAGVRTGARVWLTRGVTHGSIAPAPRGSNGFGYDPIFIPETARQTFAEIDPQEKNRLSHRGRAMRSVARHLARR